MRVFIALMGIFCCISSYATNRFVSNYGSNSYPGTYSSPFLTIQKAADVALAGDTIFIRGGTYSLYVNFSKSGTNSAPIIVMPYLSETVIIDGNNYSVPASQWDAILTLSGNYINIKGLEVSYSAGMGVGISGKYCTATNMVVHHCYQNGIIVSGNYGIVQNCTVYSNCMNNNGGYAKSEASGLSAARSPVGVILRNNIVHDNWGEGLSTYEADGTLLEGNTVYDNWSANIYISDAVNIICQRNLVYNTKSLNNGAMVGIMMGDEICSPASSDISILDNVVRDCNINLYRWGSNCSTGMTNLLIANNTFVNSTKFSTVELYSPSKNANVQFINNIVSQNANLIPIYVNSNQGISFSNNLWSVAPQALAAGYGDIIANPQFVGSTDYSLKNTSPAINAGVDIGLTADFVGNTINGLPDIGAYEFLSSSKISISSPLTGTKFTAPASFTINATATSAYGAVAKVDFYKGNTLLGTEYTSPYSFTVNDVSEGDYILTAKMTDDSGTSFVSARVAVSVEPGISPVVSVPSDVPPVVSVPSDVPPVVSIPSDVSPVVTTSSNKLPVVSVSGPISGTIYTAPASLSIDATASETSGIISKVDFYQGTTLLCTDSVSPYSFSWTNVPSGRYSITAIATDILGTTAISPPVSITVVNAGGVITTSSAISTSMDDVEESYDGWIYTNSSDIELVCDSVNGLGNQTDGLRFINAAIPKNAVITHAYIQFTCKAVTTNNCNLEIRGDASDNSLAFDETAYDVSARTKTLATVYWAPSAWNTVYAATPDQQTPNISSILQEIVDRPGYSSSSAISLIITGSGTRNSIAYDAGAQYAAKLVVSYTYRSANQLPPVVAITNPLSGTTYASPAALTISATASEIDGTIAKLELYQGATLLNTDSISPSSFSWTNVPPGTYSITAKATDKEGVSTISEPVRITVFSASEPLISSASISTSSDDAEESPSGWVNTISPDIELVNDTGNSIGNQTVGLRFSNLAIPQNALIPNAYLQFTSDQVTTGTCNLVINGEAADNSPVFTNSYYNVSARKRTSASVGWTPAAWNKVFVATPDQCTPNISSIIQEIVSRAGYSSSSSISLIISGTGTRTAVSYEQAPAQAAHLVVEYAIPELLKSADIIQSASVKATVNEIPENSANLVCYPVPFKNQLHIDFTPAVGESIISTEIFDPTGKCIFSSKNSTTQNVINLPNLNAGMYIVRVHTNKGLYSKLTIKQ